MAGNPPPYPPAAGYQPAPGGPISGPEGASYYPAMGPPGSSSIPYPSPGASGSPYAYPPQPQPYPYGYPVAGQQQTVQQPINPMDPPVKPASPAPYTTAPAAGGQEYVVTGYIASVHAPGSQPMQPMAVQAQPYGTAAPAPPIMSGHTVISEPCGCCTAGWVLFGVGFMFPICWLVAIFLPICSRNPNDRRAAIGSGIMLAIYIIVIVLAVAIPLSIMAGEAVNSGGLTAPTVATITTAEVDAKWH